MRTDSTMLAAGDPTRMTLGEAMEVLEHQDWACACVGGPMCCLRVHRQAEALKRGAHIAVRLLADAQRLERP